ncbi:MAG: THUMP domain-containing protein [Desulfobacteraceae bacterium]|jgi:putative N6-adenine-specific DNA methylase
MFQYQQTKTYFAQISDGLETLAQNELETLGATKVHPAYRGVYFTASPDLLYGINYQSRLISRILAPLRSFKCADRTDLYQAAKSINWDSIFSLGQTFGIFSNVSGNDNLRHSKFAALCVKDAVVDQFRERCGERPNVDKTNPDVWIHLLINKTKGTISLDTSGGSLHKRGYRKESVAAPIKETLAAAMVALSRWKGDRPLYDPMCGSGTLLCEALMVAGRLPAGYLRPRFGFRHLPDFDNDLWLKVKNQADANIRRIEKGVVAGSDIAHRCVKSAKINCGCLPGGRTVTVVRRDFNDIERLENHLILCNPPYGVRLRNADELGAFYKSLGDFLKRRCKGSQAYIFFGTREMIKKIGLKPSWKKPMRNAGLDGRVAKYDLY